MRNPGKLLLLFLLLVLPFALTYPAKTIKAKPTPTTTSVTTTEVSKALQKVSSSTEDKVLAKDLSKETKIPYWLSELLISLLIILVSWLVYWSFRRHGIQLLLKLAHHTSSNLDDKVIMKLRSPVSWILFSFGIWITITRLRIPTKYTHLINVGYVAFLTLMGAVIVGRLVNVSLDWYAKKAATKTGSDVDTQFVPIIQKTLIVLIWITAVILVLDQFGYKITWLITSLGIGGLAVALALQDTLTNFFSGFYIMMDKPIRNGDFVRLDSGQEGFIDQIGWRSTRIRAFANNIIIIPNSKLAQSVITNCYMPSLATTAIVECGVGYGSNLEQVERLCIEVGKEVQNRIEGAQKDFVPIVRFYEFGNSNINFRVILSVTDFLSQYVLKHEYMKALYQRFNEENIEIAFPKRSVYIEKMPDLPSRRTRSTPPSQPGLFDDPGQDESQPPQS